MNTTVETREQAFRRLLQVARESGVRLGRDRHGNYWATSVSEPGRLYAVTPDSCGCKGFQVARRCRHVAALMSHLGYFDPEPTTPTASTSCAGLGGRWVPVFDGERRLSHHHDTFVPCPGCDACHKVAA